MFSLIYFHANSLDEGLRSKRREEFLSILGSCYTTLDAKLFEDASTLLSGHIGTFLQIRTAEPVATLNIKHQTYKASGIISPKRAIALSGYMRTRGNDSCHP